MKKIFVCCLLFVVCGFSFAQIKYETREEKLQQLKIRDEIKVTEMEKDILKLEYPNGKALYKNIGEYQQPAISHQQPTTYSSIYDSTIIDLTTIDTTLYYQKYNFWQEVPIHNWQFEHIMIGDINDNKKLELYGSRKFFQTEQEPVTIYELNNANKFEYRYQYDTTLLSWDIYDVDKDGKIDVLLGGFTYAEIDSEWYELKDARLFVKPTEVSFAELLKTKFIPYDSMYQLNNINLGDFDGDQATDLLFARGAGGRDVHIFEYNPLTNAFDSLYRFAVSEEPEYAVSGFSIYDFDLDGKIDIVFGTGRGAVYVLENEGNNQYTKSWQGNVETYHSYVHTWTNDIDGNGKPEFWVLGDAFYNGTGITRITLFEANSNNSYQVVGRIDLIGVFSFYAGTMQAVDIDKDGIDEVAVCIDGNFLILKFNGSENYHTYEIHYIKQNETYPEGEWTSYFGAIMEDLQSDGDFDIMISMLHVIEQPGDDLGRFVTKIYKPDSTTSVNDDDEILPTSVRLFQNYPNPFNPVTNIKFQLDKSERVIIKAYNILGKEIKLLMDKELPAGEYKIQWDGKDDKGNSLSGGVYFIQMIAIPNGRQAGKYQHIIKSVLLK